MATIPIQFRKGVSSLWTSSNPILAEGEVGYETDTGLYKVGDGSTLWNSLAYVVLSPTVDILTLTGQSSDPAAPTDNRALLYSKSYAGRILPKFKGPSGVDTAIQPALFNNGITMYVPGTTTGVNVFGGPALTSVGTVSHPALSSGSFRESISRWIITSAGTSNSVSACRMGVTRVYRGDAAGRGGFFISTRFAVSTAVANQQVFIGLLDTTSALSTSQTPSALTNCIGVGWDSADTVLQIMHNDGSDSATKVGLGSNFPANDTSAVYEFQLFAAPNGSTVSYRVKKLDSSYETTGTISGNLPSSTTFLTFHGYMNNGGTASAVILEMMRIYIETDN